MILLDCCWACRVLHCRRCVKVWANFDTMKHVAHCASWVVGVDFALFAHRAFLRLCFFLFFFGCVNVVRLSCTSFLFFFRPTLPTKSVRGAHRMLSKQFSHERAKHWRCVAWWPCNTCCTECQCLPTDSGARIRPFMQ